MVLDKVKEKNFKIFFYCAQFSLIQMFSLNIYSYNITFFLKKKKIYRGKIPYKIWKLPRTYLSPHYTWGKDKGRTRADF